MTARSVHFTGPREVTVREHPVPDPSAGELRFESIVSAISPGTELLVYRGEVPNGPPADATIDALDESLEYPVQYGYATVGRVTAVGEGVSADWSGELVFAFHPHASHGIAAPEDVRRVPEPCPPERAAFLANVEAATSFVMDGRPRIGEEIAVFGQGVVGLLTTALLAEFPLSGLVTVEPHGSRRELSEQLGADESLPPDCQIAPAFDTDDGADLTFELSGNPEALDAAVDATGYAGRLVVGSWYGDRRTDLDLGGRFHRSHIRIRSSQVSSVDPDHAGRFTKDRRFELVWQLLRTVEPHRLVTHRLPVERAPEAYRLLDQSPDETVQVLLTY